MRSSLLQIIWVYGCGNSNPTPDKRPMSEGTPPSAPQIAGALRSDHSQQSNTASVLDHIYRVGCDGSLGTGFTDKAGRVVTARHVVIDCKPPRLRKHDNEDLQLTLIFEHENSDVAILLPPTPLPSGLQLASASPNSGARLLGLGYPLGYDAVKAKSTDGYFGGSALKQGAPQRGPWAWSSIPLRHGNSGGPLIDASSSLVVGLVSQLASHNDETRMGMKEIARVAIEPSATNKPTLESAQHIVDDLLVSMDGGLVLSPPTETLHRIVSGP